MALKLNDPVVKALVTRLTDRLPTYIDEVNAEAATIADGYTIGNPAAIFPMIPSEQLLTQWPAIGVQDLPTKLEDDIGSSATAVCDLAIVCFLNDPSLEALGWRLRRYVRAVASAALENRELGTGGSAAYGVTLVGTQPGPTLGDHEDPAKVKTYVSYSAVVIRALAEE